MDCRYESKSLWEPNVFKAFGFSIKLCFIFFFAIQKCHLRYIFASSFQGHFAC